MVRLAIQVKYEIIWLQLWAIIVIYAYKKEKIENKKTECVFKLAVLQF